jgi:hypothetical protein
MNMPSGVRSRGSVAVAVCSGAGCASAGGVAVAAGAAPVGWGAVSAEGEEAAGAAGEGVAGGDSGAGVAFAGGSLGDACCAWTAAGPQTTIRATQPALATWKNHCHAACCQPAILADFDSILFHPCAGYAQTFPIHPPMYWRLAAFFLQAGGDVSRDGKPRRLLTYSRALQRKTVTAAT